MVTLKDAIRLKKDVTLYFPNGGIRGDHVFLLTPAQINRLDKAQVEGRRVQNRLSARQVTKNVSYTGGFIMSLALALPFAARVLPTSLSGLTTGLRSGGINKAISGSGAAGDGNGLYLAPHCVKGDGLFLKHGDDISDGAGLRLGKNSPFKNIPVLEWLL